MLMLHGMAKISIWTNAMKKKREQNMQLLRENIDVMFSLRRKDIWEMESNVSEIQGGCPALLLEEQVRQTFTNVLYLFSDLD